jgi:hypothetical protein
MSLSQLTVWCDARFGAFSPTSDRLDRPYDTTRWLWTSMMSGGDFGWKIDTFRVS